MCKHFFRCIPTNIFYDLHVFTNCFLFPFGVHVQKLCLKVAFCISISAFVLREMAQANPRPSAIKFCLHNKLHVTALASQKSKKGSSYGMPVLVWRTFQLSVIANRSTCFKQYIYCIKVQGKCL